MGIPYVVLRPPCYRESQLGTSRKHQKPRTQQRLRPRLAKRDREPRPPDVHLPSLPKVALLTVTVDEEGEQLRVLRVRARVAQDQRGVEGMGARGRVREVHGAEDADAQVGPDVLGVFEEESGRGLRTGEDVTSAVGEAASEEFLLRWAAVNEVRRLVRYRCAVILLEEAHNRIHVVQRRDGYAARGGRFEEDRGG